MGEHSNYFFGPFIICHFVLENNLIEKEKHFHACGNDKCKLYNKDINDIVSSLVYGKKFCPECGASLSSISETYKVPKFYVYDVSNKVDDKFVPVNVENIEDYEIKDKKENINVFLPNVKINGMKRKCFYSDNSDSCCILINDGQPYYEKEIFEKFFENELKEIKLFYDDIVIAWGFVKYFL